MSPIPVLDLFSAAAGGWSLGLHRAGFETVAACEAVEWRRQLYAVNNPNVVLYDDVRTLTANRIVSDLGYLPTVVVGSPPCQDISSANTKGKGVDGERSGLYFEAVRIIGEVRPRWFALENSDRLRTRGYDRIAAELEALDYHVWPVVVGAGHAGASHLRRRSIVIGLDANAASEQAWFAGQSWMGSHADCLGREASGSTRGGWERREEAACDTNGIELRFEPGWPGWQDGAQETFGWLSSIFRGPAGAQSLSSHLRAYDGLPAGVAELCRQAYGDAFIPQLAEIVGRAILRTEQALASVHGRVAA